MFAVYIKLAINLIYSRLILRYGISLEENKLYYLKVPYALN